MPGVVLEFIDTAAIIRFNRPASRNSLSSRTLTGLDSIFSEATSRSDVRAIIFTGTDDVFASGADIRELAKLDQVSARAFSERGQRLFQRIADAPQLTVAAINGYCMGGALDLSLACDVRLAAGSAIFAHPGSQLGIITGWGGTQRLPRLIGKSRALELFFTGRRFSAAEALRIGLISAIEDSVLDAAIKFSRKTKKEAADCSATPHVTSN
ncbi:MAG: enoyl-CoA hydratase [Acidobacteria bacterium]|nr:enoyl-CoA hydratase [Acidobacteriota bacterium]